MASICDSSELVSNISLKGLYTSHAHQNSTMKKYVTNNQKAVATTTVPGLNSMKIGGAGYGGRREVEESLFGQMEEFTYWEGESEKEYICSVEEPQGKVCWHCASPHWST